MCIRCSRSTRTWIHVPLDRLNHDQEKIMEHNAQQAQKEEIMEHNTQSSKDTTSRRSFLSKGLAVGGAGLIGTGLLANGLSLPAFAEERKASLTQGDVAILRFLAAVEILESDLWQQYNELALGNESYQLALNVLDGDQATYVNLNTRDEFSHAAFINKYLESKGHKPVSLEQFRRLPSSQATGSNTTAKRLTNLMQLTVDTSFYF